MITVVVENSVLRIKEFREVRIIYLYNNILLVDVVICTDSGKLSRLVENIGSFGAVSRLDISVMEAAFVIAVSLSDSQIDC